MIFIILLFAICCASTVAPQMAKTNCQTDCGGVAIPYPYGIGSNESCYFDEWFQIDCNISTKSKPFLRRAKLEVLNISISKRKLQVNSPITFFCQRNNSQVVELRESPFVYDKLDNIFTAMSCDSLALIRSKEFVVGGCRSVCDRDYEYLNCESGINCCQTSIPPYLTIFNATSFKNTRNCNKFAFLVDKDWFKRITISSSTTTSVIKSMPNVPVTLKWRLKNNTRSFALFQKFIVDIHQYNESACGPVLIKSHGHSLSKLTDPYCNISTSHAAGNWTKVCCYCRHGFQGNPYLGELSCEDIDECMGANRCPGHSKCVNYLGLYRCEGDQNKAKLILTAGLSSSVGLLLLLIGAWFGYRFLKKRNEIKRKQTFFKRNGGLLLEQQLSSGEVNVEKIKLFKSQELEKSTDNFNSDRILGKGGQGTVYKGMLEDGRIVAVKKSTMVDESQLSEFINEVVILSQISHRNVVQLLGCCLETEIPLLVYEFIPNGTLSKYITEHNEEFPLAWKMRLRIAKEIAEALSYLHCTASFPIYHRDIKSTNILLDEKYRAKIADFGTSRSISIDQTHLTTSLVYGTFGYLDPEYFQSSQFTEKSDVYSFGVVLVELLTGQKPISFMRSEEEGRSLATYFIISMHKDRLFEIVDARVLKEAPKADIIIVANLARRCLNLKGRKRPTMREVTTELEGIQISEKTSIEEHNYEEVEFVGTELVEPWDTASSSSSTGTGSALDAGRGLSFHESHYCLSSQFECAKYF